MKANHKYNSLSVREPTPEGMAFINIVEESPGKILMIQSTIGKAGTAVRTYTYAIDELVTALFIRGASITEVIDLLSDISSDRSAGFGQNRSFAEAIASALRKYMASLDEVPTGELKVARLANR